MVVEGNNGNAVEEVVGKEKIVDKREVGGEDLGWNPLGPLSR